MMSKIPRTIIEVKAKHKMKLLKMQNVVGMGYGLKYKSGKRTDRDCIVVFVRKKVDLSELRSRDVIPEDLDGVAVDVKEIGILTAHKNRTDRWRPSPGGVSVGHYDITAGTLGAFVKDKTTGETLILSNNHVMANSNVASRGDAILQPGPIDGGQNPQDRIANLERWVRIDYSGGGDDNGGSSCPIAKSAAGIMNSAAKLIRSQSRLTTYRVSAVANEVDAAVAKPVDGSVIDDEIIDIGKIDGVKDPELGMAVRKSGRTTGTTTGTIESLDATVQVGYGGNRVAQFEHQILTTNMSQPGDSGSLLVDGSENKAVALLFAGSDQVTVHSPIQKVMELLEIEF